MIFPFGLQSETNSGKSGLECELLHIKESRLIVQIHLSLGCPGNDLRRQVVWPADVYA